MTESLKAPRKSCDLCYLRKIKCDGQRPRCSHCIIYAVDCTFSAPSRIYKPKRRRKSSRTEDGAVDLKTRVDHLEMLFEQLTESSYVHKRQSEHEHEVQEQEPISIIGLPTTTTSVEKPPDHANKSFAALDIPPQLQTLHIIHLFLEHFNLVLPLFHAESLSHLVHEFYSHRPNQRDPVVWAAIHVVLALAYRKGLLGNSSTGSAIQYLNKVQSVLSDVILGDIQLLNIQVLVGMVMLLEGAEDLQPALVLIATTIRLAHRIGLHTRATSVNLDPVVARQRAYVFWIAYIMDKNLSLRSKQPSIQLDDDIDLDLPGFPSNEVLIDSTAEINQASISDGVITTIDGTRRMNYFQSRIQLAVIEGGVYDYLFSTRSQKRSREERKCALESVARALQQWKESVPLEFHGAEAAKNVSRDRIQFLYTLDGTSLMCTTCINQAHFMNAQWLASLRRYGIDGTTPMLPPQWEALVDEARDLMILFEQLGAVDRWNWWTTGCSYMTAMMLLTANSMHRPRHDQSSLDMRLVDAGMQTLNGMVEEIKSDLLRSIRNTCAELYQYAQQMHGQAIAMAGEGDFASCLPDT